MTKKTNIVKPPSPFRLAKRDLNIAVAKNDLEGIQSALLRLADETKFPFKSFHHKKALLCALRVGASDARSRLGALKALDACRAVGVANEQIFFTLLRASRRKESGLRNWKMQSVAQAIRLLAHLLHHCILEYSVIEEVQELISFIEGAGNQATRERMETLSQGYHKRALALIEAKRLGRPVNENIMALFGVIHLLIHPRFASFPFWSVESWGSKALDNFSLSIWKSQFSTQAIEALYTDTGLRSCRLGGEV